MLRASGLALLASLALAAPAQAASWLDPTLPFGDAPARSGDAGMAMAPDGTIVAARFSPDEALEVRERPPGGPFGATITLPHALIDPRPEPHMQVLMGANGTAAILFDAGTVRYATLRPPGGTWTRPQVLAPEGTDEAGIGQDGAVWAAGDDPEAAGGLALFRLAAGGHPERRPLPPPPGGADDREPSPAPPHSGGAYVAHLQRAAARRPLPDRLRVGEETLATAVATGPAPQNCHIDAGELLGPPQLAADSDGALTVAYPVL